MVAAVSTYAVSIILVITTLSAAQTDPPACKIYCEGEVLDLVQKANMYKDSKTFVDMRMKYPANTIIARFNNMMRNVNNQPTKWTLKRFLRKHFIGPGDEFESHRPHDWKEEPEILSRIHDHRLRNWAKALNSYWLSSCRSVRPEVRDNPNEYSLLYLPNPIIMPGGKFREYRYWDTYWIVLGLLRCEMFNTAKGILDNLIQLVETYGFVPSGGRIYHLGRSELPLLIPMVMMYYQFTGDEQFIESNVITLEDEFKYWMEHRSVEIDWHNESIKLAHYDGEVARPRPEAYLEDLKAVSNVSSKKTKDQIYINLRAASEAGWDISSRWLIHGKGSRSKKLEDIKTRKIIPVDLNAILCWNAKILQEFFMLIGENEKSREYKIVSADWQRSVTRLLWSEADGTWYDYDNLNKKSRQYFYASNLTPLWTMCYDKNKTDHIAKKIVNYLTKLRITYFEGGIPVSNFKSGHLYDFPTNVPPLQHIIIMGLKNTDIWEAKELAFKLAFNWIRASFKGFSVSGLMFDLYHCEEPGVNGSKNDVPDQVGYGWTNGVCLDLLDTYGNVVHSHGIDAGGSGCPSLPIIALLLSLLLKVAIL